MADHPRIIFMGTPDFAVPSLDILCANDLRPVAVVTAPDKPRGRGQRVTPTAVKAAAVRHGIETILQPSSVRDPEFADAVRSLRPDIIVVVAFRILPPEVFEAARLGTFNLHGSLLPRYRGAAPINRAIMAGDEETGVTTFFLREAVDTGNVIMTRSMSVGPDETAGEVHDRMMHLGAEVVLETVRRIVAGSADAMPQDDALATPAPKIFRDDARIDWTRSATEVHNHVRGLSPYPGAWTHHGETQLKVFRTRLAEGSGRPGEVIATSNGLVVGCGKGAVEILAVQQEGKRRLPARDFLLGYEMAAGETLG